MKSTPVFEKNYDSTKKIVINRGGTRSSKSYSLVQLAVLFLTSGYVSPGIQLETGVWSFVRKTLPALRASVLRDFEQELFSEGFYSLVKINKSELTYTYQGRMVEFFSVDNEQKVRSRKRDVLDMCEANEMEYEDFRQLLIRTQYRVYLDFNPDDDQSWIKTELEDKRLSRLGDVEVIQSSYLDNPFLSKGMVAEIEDMKVTDSDYFAIFGKGEYVTFAEKRFWKNWNESKHVQKVEYNPEYELHASFDFNISNSCTLSQCGNGWDYTLREYRAELYDLEQLCTLIQSDYPDARFTIHGDASGRAGSALTTNNESAYEIIKQSFSFPTYDYIEVPKKNPFHKDSYFHCLLALARLDYRIDPSCKELIADHRSMKVLKEDGKFSIDKSNEKIGHLGDTKRYAIHANHQYLLLKKQQMHEE